jgi:hypothetical protein
MQLGASILMARSRGNGGVIGSKITTSAIVAPGVWNIVDSVPNLLNNSWPSVLSLASGYTAYLDFGLTSSYPGSGTTVTDLSPTGANATINGSPAFVSAGVNGTGSYLNFATKSGSNYVTSSSAQAYLDCTIVFYPDLALTTGISGLIANSTEATNSDRSMRFNCAVGGWTMNNPDNTNAWVGGSPGTTMYLNTVAYTGANVPITTSGWYVIGGTKNNSLFGATWNYFLGSGGFNSGRSFQGRIAAMVLYNRSLTAAEQKQNYNYFANRFGLSYVA